MSEKDLEVPGFAGRRHLVSSDSQHRSSSIAGKRGLLSVMLAVKSSFASENFNGREGLRYAGTIRWSDRTRCGCPLTPAIRGQRVRLRLRAHAYQVTSQVPVIVNGALAASSPAPVKEPSAATVRAVRFAS